MRTEDKELLLKDLCARLHYGVKIKLGDYDYQVCGYNSEKEMPVKIWYYYDSNQTLKSYIDVYLEDYRPYLRPMSSMTEKERKEYKGFIIHRKHVNAQGQEWDIDCFSFDTAPRLIDWFNKHHFDYHGLIEKGLAIEAPNNMYKI